MPVIKLGLAAKTNQNYRYMKISSKDSSDMASKRFP